MLGIFDAFVGLYVYGGMVRFRGNVAHTLMRRFYKKQATTQTRSH